MKLTPDEEQMLQEFYREGLQEDERISNYEPVEGQPGIFKHKTKIDTFANIRDICTRHLINKCEVCKREGQI